MTISDVRWIRDAHGKLALDLLLDGQHVRIRSSQRPALTRLGLLDGVVLLASNRGGRMSNPLVQGDYAPTFQPRDLVGCTDNPTVFALYQAMCDAIRGGTWQAGARPSGE
ncbi:MAG: hypothetical protein AB7P40_25110 [Chloroflexota bacterium]